MTCIDMTVDLDDTHLTAHIAKVGAGNYQSWAISFMFGASRIRFDASDSKDVEDLLDQLVHDLMMHRTGALRTVDGRIA